jgi:hypothetical protein
MSVIVDRISLHWERGHPIVFGLAGFVTSYLYGAEALCWLHAKHWVIENIFVAVFTLGTVAAGFGLAIYTFLLTTETGFIGRAKKSMYYRNLLTYVLHAIIMSGGVAILSIPGMIINEAPQPYSLHALYVALWFGLLTAGCAALFRAGHLFSIFAREHH